MTDQTSQQRLSDVAIIGLGYVGLSLAILFCHRGFHVLGVDTDQEKLRLLEAGKSYVTNVADEELQNALRQNLLQVSMDFATVANVETIIICVPTPLTDNHQPDMRYVKSAITGILPYVRQGQLIILESSTYPGTTEEMLRPAIEAVGLSVGHDVFVAYSPERVDPGLEFPLVQIPKVVSGCTQRCARKVTELYEQVFDRVVPVSSTWAAEMVKLLENTQRFVNISFMNEMSILCHALGIDIWEVIEAAKSKPFGFTPYYPGPGIGGHCIPVDPLYLRWTAHKLNIPTPAIDAAERTNTQMTTEIVHRIRDVLPTQSLKGMRILIIGVTYKANTNDLRESPAIPIMTQLQRLGANVTYHDNYVPYVHIENTFMTSEPLHKERLAAADCVVILADHQYIDYEFVVASAKVVVDTRNATSKVSARSNVITF